MKIHAIAAMAVLSLATPAFADTKPSADEAAKLTEALLQRVIRAASSRRKPKPPASSKSTMPRTRSGAQFDIKLDKDFKILSVTRD